MYYNVNLGLKKNFIYCSKHIPNSAWLAEPPPPPPPVIKSFTVLRSLCRHQSHANKLDNFLPLKCCHTLVFALLLTSLLQKTMFLETLLLVTQALSVEAKTCEYRKSSEYFYSIFDN
jgi:hypothetical protein